MGGANFFVPIALAGFVPVVFACLAKLGPRRGVLASLLGGWLFLPCFDGAYDVPFLHAKAVFVPAVVLVASFLWDGGRWFRLRPRLLDAPMVVLCLVPFAASLSNGLGAYDGAATSLQTIMAWGAPYLLGRLYLGDPGGIRDFAASLVASTLAYVPLCLWEIRMSPQLHRIVYGFHTFGFFGQAVRFGGFRPSVFMSHGLMLGMFMAIGSLTALWMWRTGARRTIARLPISWVSVLLTITTVLCKSTGAILLLATGLMVLELTRRLRTSALVLVLLALPSVYCAARLSGWTGENLVALSEGAINEDRAGSLDFRMVNEGRLIVKALQRPWLGWGGWGRSRVYDEEGTDATVTDSLWIIVLGASGLVGLLALALTLALPGFALLRRFPALHWRDPRLAPAVALTMALLLWAVDDLFNAMTTPIFPAIAGALLSLSSYVPRARSLQPCATSSPSRAASARIAS